MFNSQLLDHIEHFPAESDLDDIDNTSQFNINRNITPKLNNSVQLKNDVVSSSIICNDNNTIHQSTTLLRCERNNNHVKYGDEIMIISEERKNNHCKFVNSDFIWIKICVVLIGIIISMLLVHKNGMNIPITSSSGFLLSFVWNVRFKIMLIVITLISFYFIFQYIENKRQGKVIPINNSLCDDTSNRTTISNDDECIRMIEESRRNISKLLGIIGAPMLLSHHNNYYPFIFMTTTQKFEEMKERFYIIECMLSVHIDFFHIIDEVMNVIKIGTSIKYGLGINSRNNIVRIERNRLYQMNKLQQIRQQQNNNSLLSQQLPISSSSSSIGPLLVLPTIRKRLNLVLNNQLSLLLETIRFLEDDDDNIASKKNDITMNNNFVLPEQLVDEVVISLTHLQSLKYDIVEALSESVSRWIQSRNDNVTMTDEIKNVFLTTIANTKESCSYLNGLLYTTDYYNNIIIQQSGTIKNDEKNTNIPNILQTHHHKIWKNSEALRVLILNCHEFFWTDNSMKQTDTNNIMCHSQQQHEFQNLWSEVQTISNTLQNLLVTMNENIMNDNLMKDNTNTCTENSSLDIDNSITKTDDDKNNILASPPELEDHNEIWNNIDDNRFHNAHGTPVQNGQTYVFTGKGLPKANCHRRNHVSHEKKKTSTLKHSGTTVPAVNHEAFKYSLIEELKFHLLSLPRNDEIEVKNSSMIPTNHQSSNPAINIAATPLIKESPSNMNHEEEIEPSLLPNSMNSTFIFAPTLSLIQDLKNSIASFHRSDDSDDNECILVGVS